MATNNKTPHRRLYGRRKGRPLNASRQEVMDTLLPLLGIKPKKVRAGAQLSPQALFGYTPPATWFEIGFGNGEHVAGLYKQNPDHGYIGAEPFINGMAALLKTLKDDFGFSPDFIKDHPEHSNLRLWMEDAILLADALADHCLDGIYVLNPDPWPKKRHHKRRIINKANLDRFARILKPGGLLVATTDVDDLAEWMITEMSNHPAFEWTVQKADDWRMPPKNWIPTRYEEKGIAAGRRQSYLIFQRKEIR